MLERRKTVRTEPAAKEDIVEIELAEGVVSNVSEGGICVIVPGYLAFDIGQQVTVDYLGHSLRAVVRNVTYDMMTAGYGLEWVQPLPSELQSLLP